jgi:hypothetical protein
LSRHGQSVFPRESGDNVRVERGEMQNWLHH